MTDPITAEVRAQRLAALENAKHSAEMEGGHVPERAEAIIREYAEGHISEEEMHRQMQAHYGPR